MDARASSHETQHSCVLSKRIRIILFIILRPIRILLLSEQELVQRVLLNNELGRGNRKTRTLAQNKLSAMELNARLASSHQNQQFQHAVREHQRRARDAVSQTVLESSVRLEVTLSLELRQGTYKP